MSDKTLKEELEQVRREIDEFLAEKLSGARSSAANPHKRSGRAGQDSPAPESFKVGGTDSGEAEPITQRSASPGVFACSSEAIDETGYGFEEERCICRDPDVKPWQRCPRHDAVVD